MRPILIVEDEPAIADLIEMTLEPLGQPLIKAHTGNEPPTCWSPRCLTLFCWT